MYYKINKLINWFAQKNLQNRIDNNIRENLKEKEFDGKPACVSKEKVILFFFMINLLQFNSECFLLSKI